MRHAHTALLFIALLLARCGRHPHPASVWVQAERGTIHIQTDLFASMDKVVEWPNNAAPVQRSNAVIGGIARNGIYMQAPSRARFPVFVHPSARLSTWFALLPASWEGSTDGAEFRVSVVTEDAEDVVMLGATTLNPRVWGKDRAWFLREYDLSPWVGSRILVELAVDPGPAGDSYRDWCIWGDPVVVSPPFATPPTTPEEVSLLIESGALRLDWSLATAGALPATADSSLDLAGVRREGVHARPPWELALNIVPGSRARFTASLGMAESCWTKSDGVMYRILAQAPGQAPVTLFEYLLNPKVNRCDRAWVDIMVDVSQFSDRPVVLTLATTGGPADHLYCDSVVLAHPRIIAARYHPTTSARQQ
ncbi:hypothetical protein JXA88_10975 [Candidatus Fermentibacteria bacterium]|nr:hypothetical protein [Candidatus Fermentibacteria bacterium]